MPRTLPTLLCLSFLSLGQPTWAQQVGGTWETVRDFRSHVEASAIACEMGRLGDLNGDGVAEFAIGSPYADVGGGMDNGLVTIRSGRDGALMYTMIGVLNGDHLGSAINGLDDLDGDGIPEFIIGAGKGAISLDNQGIAFVHSGASGAVLRTHVGGYMDELGSDVANLGDVDGDGISDYAIGSPDATVGPYQRGLVEVYSGSSGAVLATIMNPAVDRSRFGHAVAGLGDLDGDGIGEILIGAPYSSGQGFNVGGEAFVYSGSTFQLMHVNEGRRPAAFFGWEVADAGDLDHDQVPDYAVGAIRGGLILDHGAVRVFSGATGLEIYTVDGLGFGGDFGRSFDFLDDLDGDGCDDLLVGAPYHPGSAAGTATLFSGSDGSIIKCLDPPLHVSNFGEGVLGFEDLDGDGLPEFFVASNLDDRGLLLNYCQLISPRHHLDSSDRQLSASQGGSLSFHLDFPRDRAGEHYRLLGSGLGTTPSLLQGLEVPLVDQGLIWDAMINPDGGGPFSGHAGLLDAQGDAVVHLILQPTAAAPFVGRTLHFAAVVGTTATGPTLSSVAVPLEILP